MKNELNELIKQAMLAGNKLELSVLRFIKNEFSKFETAPGATELTEEMEIKILNKMVKERIQSIDMYNEGGRPELSEIEMNEINVIKTFLPKEASDEEVKAYLEEIYNIDNRNMGFYVKEIKQRYPTANGKSVADIVKQKLSI